MGGTDGAYAGDALQVKYDAKGESLNIVRLDLGQIWILLLLDLDPAKPDPNPDLASALCLAFPSA